MKQEDKELLLKDLCCRSPYGVKVEYFYGGAEEFCVGVLGSVYPLDEQVFIGRLPLQTDCSDFDEIYLEDNLEDIENVRPFLYPLSSRTMEQVFEINEILGGTFEIDKYSITDLIRNRRTSLSYLELDALFEYLNKNHFDYRGLIEKGLAIDATNLGIYK